MKAKFLYFAALAAVAAIAIVLGLSLGLRSDSSASGSTESTTTGQTEDTTISPTISSTESPATVIPTESPVASIPAESPVTSIPAESPVTSSFTENTEIASSAILQAIKKLGDAQVVRVQSSLFENSFKVDISFNAEGDGIGTITTSSNRSGNAEILGNLEESTQDFLVVNKSAFVRPDQGRWGSISSLYGLVNTTLLPFRMTHIFETSIKTAEIYSNASVLETPAFMAKTYAGDIYVSAFKPYEVIRIVLQGMPNVSYTRNLLFTSDPFTPNVLDFVDESDDADAAANLAEILAITTPSLKQSLDYDRSRKLRITANARGERCGASSCRVTATVNTLYDESLEDDAYAIFTATMTIDNIRAGSCTSTGVISTGEPSDIGCTNVSPEWKSAYTRSKTEKYQYSWKVFVRANLDVSELSKRMNSRVNRIHRSNSKRSYLYQISSSKNKVWKWGITSRGNWEFHPKKMSVQCRQTARVRICTYTLYGTYSNRVTAYRMMRNLVEAFKKKNMGSLPQGQNLVPKQKRSMPNPIPKRLFIKNLPRNSGLKDQNDTTCSRYNCNKYLNKKSIGSIPFVKYDSFNLGGHHIPATKLLIGAVEEYSPKGAPAISNPFMYCCGINHNHGCTGKNPPCSITQFQINAYYECQQSLGGPVSLDIIKEIEISALVRQSGFVINKTRRAIKRWKIPEAVAVATVTSAVAKLGLKDDIAFNRIGKENTLPAFGSLYTYLTNKLSVMCTP